MKTYLFLNIATGRKAKVTEQGKAGYEANAELSKTMKLLGECDANAVLISAPVVAEVFVNPIVEEIQETINEIAETQIEHKKPKKVK